MTHNLPPCDTCHRPIRPQRGPVIPGTVRYGAKNKCSTCYQRTLREQNTATREARKQAAHENANQILNLLPTPTTTNETWRNDALCAQTDPETFYPLENHSARPAKTICAMCDVTNECLAYALTNREPFGIWGGLTPRQRQKLARRREGAA